MHKRIFACVLGAATLLSLGACSNQNSESSVSGAAVTMGSVPAPPPVRTEAAAEAEITGTQAQTASAGILVQNSGADTTAAVQNGEMPTFYATGTAKVSDGTMDVTVNLEHNSGFQLVTVRMYYDAALTPVDADGRCTYEDGTLGSKGMSTCPYNAGDHLVGYVLICQTQVKEDGDLFTVKFHLPDDAKAGDSYDFTFDVVDYNNGQDEIPAAGRKSTVTAE